MELSSTRFKAFSVTAGLSFWFFIIISAIGLFSFEVMIGFIIVVGFLTQIFAKKLTIGLDIFARFFTHVFLGILFVCVISLYGILFRILKIDLLRLKKQADTYWLNMEEIKFQRIFSQY